MNLQLNLQGESGFVGEYVCMSVCAHIYISMAVCGGLFDCSPAF